MIIKAENENCNKSTLEHSTNLRLSPNLEAAFGCSWREQAAVRHVTWESGKHSGVEHFWGFTPLKWEGQCGVRHEKNVVSLLRKTQHN